MKAVPKPSNPFKVPSGYLDRFEVQLPSALDSTKRNNSKKHLQAPFEVPSGYFESFKVKLAPTPSPVIPLYKKYSGWAAAAVLVTLFTWPFWNTENKSSNENAVATSAIDSYWDYATDALTPYDMAAFVSIESSDLLTDQPLSESVTSYLESQIHPLETIELNTTNND